MEKKYYVYILAHKNNHILYTGSTVYLIQRVYHHKIGEGSKFTKKYNVNKLVFYEEHPCIASASLRERQIKKWKRQWKDELISSFNPEWEDLFDFISR